MKPIKAFGIVVGALFVNGLVWRTLDGILDRATIKRFGRGLAESWKKYNNGR